MELSGVQVERRERTGALKERLRKADSLERQGIERTLVSSEELGEREGEKEGGSGEDGGGEEEEEEEEEGGGGGRRGDDA